MVQAVYIQSRSTAMGNNPHTQDPTGGQAFTGNYSNVWNGGPGYNMTSIWALPEVTVNIRTEYVTRATWSDVMTNEQMDVIPEDLRAKHGNGDVEGARNAREMIHSAYGPNGQYGSYYTFLAESNKNVYEEGKDNNDIVGNGGDSKMDAYNISFQNDLEVENSTRTLNFLEDNKKSNARFKIGIVNSNNSLDDIGKQVQHMGPNTPGGDVGSAITFATSVASGVNQAKSFQFNGTKVPDAGNFALNGKTYSNGFKGNQYINSGTVKAAKNTAKLVRGVSKGIGIVNILTTGALITSDVTAGRYKSAIARGVVAGVGTAVLAVPYVGVGLSIGIGILDATYGDDFYNYLEE